MYKLILIDGTTNSGKEYVCNMLSTNETFVHSDLFYNISARTSLKTLYNNAKIPFSTYMSLIYMEAENKKLIEQLAEPQYIIESYRESLLDGGPSVFQVNHLIFQKPTVVIKNMNRKTLDLFNMYGKEDIGEVTFVIIKRDFLQATLSGFVGGKCNYDILAGILADCKYTPEQAIKKEYFRAGTDYTYDFYDILNNDSYEGILNGCTKQAPANAYFTLQEKNNFLEWAAQGKFTEEDFNKIRIMVIETGIPFNDLSFESLFQDILFGNI